MGAGGLLLALKTRRVGIRIKSFPYCTCCSAVRYLGWQVSARSLILERMQSLANLTLCIYVRSTKYLNAGAPAPTAQNFPNTYLNKATTKAYQQPSRWQIPLKSACDSRTSSSISTPQSTPRKKRHIMRSNTETWTRISTHASSNN